MPFCYNLAMNQLPAAKRTQLLHMLVEGMSMRSVSRVVGVSINTVTRYLVLAGNSCSRFHDQAVRNVNARHLECDEIYTYCYAKKRNVRHAVNPPPGAGTIWTWTALDSDSRIILSWLAGNRSEDSAAKLLTDLRSRVAGFPQITTDGLRAYEHGVDTAFGRTGGFTQLVKVIGHWDDDPNPTGPAYVIGQIKAVRSGNPDLSAASTSLVERHNLTMRMSMRRFTRKSNGFSKKPENLRHMLALYFAYYNFCRPHESLRRQYDVTPAMEAGLASRPYGIDWIVDLIDADNPPPGPRGPYRRRIV